MIKEGGVCNCFFFGVEPLIDLWGFFIFIFIFILGKFRPVQSFHLTGSSWMSAGPNIVLSPVWTGLPRWFYFDSSFINKTTVLKPLPKHHETVVQLQFSFS